jgi:hypothetical protein
MTIVELVQWRVHSAPAVPNETVTRGRMSQVRMHQVVRPISQPNTDDDHVKRDGDDGHDLIVSNDVSVGLFSWQAKHDY